MELRTDYPQLPEKSNYRGKYIEKKFGASCEGLVRNFSQQGEETTLNILEELLDYELAENSKESQ